MRNQLPNFAFIGPYSFHRNILQVFLFKILKDEYPDPNNEEPLRILESLQYLIKNYNIISETSRGISYAENIDISKNTFIELNNNLQERIISLLQKYLSQIQNQFYYKIYDEKKEFVLNALESQNIIELKSLINKIDTDLVRELKLIKAIDLQSENYTNTLTLLERLKKSGLFNPIAKDYIKNQFQHLPTLLFVSTEYEQSVSGNFFKLLNLLTETPIGNDLENKLYCELLDPILESITYKRSNLTLVNYELIITNFFLIISKPDLIYSSPNSNIIIKNLERHRDRILSLQIILNMRPKNLIG